MDAIKHSYVCFLHSKCAVQDVRAKGLICILDVDIAGVRHIKESDLDPIYVSIQPPSIEVLVRVHNHTLHSVLLLQGSATGDKFGPQAILFGPSKFK